MNSQPFLTITKQSLTVDSGLNGADYVTNNGSFSINGMVTADAAQNVSVPGVTLAIYDGDAMLGLATVSGRYWSFSGTLAAGTHNLSAKATDSAGHYASVSAQTPITVESGAPSVSVASQIVESGAVALTGAVAGAHDTKVEIYDDGTLLGNAALDGKGGWSFQAIVAAGSHSLYAVAADGAGDTAVSATQATVTTGGQAAVADIPFDKTFQGISLSSGGHGFDSLDSKEALDQIVGDHANSVSIVTGYYVSTGTSSDLGAIAGKTSSLSAISEAILDAEARGLNVMLKPHINVLDGSFSGSYKAADVDDFFAKYKAELLDLAKVAQADHVAVFSIGNEFDTMASNYLPQWTDLIDSIRHVYTGELTYAATRYSLNSVVFLNQLDYIGVNAYLPLATSVAASANITVDQLVHAWTTLPSGYLYNLYGGKSFVDYMHDLSIHYDKPVLITEVGYRSDDQAAFNPGDWQTVTTPDAALQAKLYQALYEVWGQQGDWFKGLFTWGVGTQATPTASSPDDYTTEGKPADAVISGAYDATGTTTSAAGDATTIVIHAAGGNTNGVLPEMVVTVDGLILGKISVTGKTTAGDYEDYRFTAGTIDPSRVQIYLGNTATGTSLNIDYIDVNGIRYQAEDPNVVNTAARPGTYLTPTSSYIYSGNGSLTFNLAGLTGTVVVPPTVAVASLTMARDTGVSAADHVTNNGTMTLTGQVTGAAGTIVRIMDGGTVLGIATLDHHGGWTFTTTLAAGSHALHAEATDIAGNTAISATQPAVLVETSAPALNIDTQILAHDTGASGSDLVTGNGAVTLAGTVGNVDGGTLVKIYDGATLLGNAAVSNGNWTFTANLASGTHALHAVATDLAGNVSTSAAQPAITVDNAAPVMTIASQLTHDTGASASDRITSDGAVVLTGKVTDATATQIGVFDGTVLLGNATVANGNWTYATTLAAGIHALHAEATDLAGNIAISAAQSTIEVRLAPQVTITSQAFTGHDLTLKGTVSIAAGTTVNVFDGTARLGSAVVAGTGVWTYSGTLTAGSHTLHASATDIAGNSASVTATSPILFNDPAPTDPSLQGKIVLSVSEEAYLANAQFSVTVDGHQVGGVYTATADHGQGHSQDIVLDGSYSAGSHVVSIDYLNDAWAGQNGQSDRNLYVDAITVDGVRTAENHGQYIAGAQSYDVAGSVDTLVLNMSETAYKGDAQFIVSVDGKQVGGVETVKAAFAQGHSDDFVLHGDFAAGKHTVTVNYINDLWSGAAGKGDRDLHVDSITLNGVKTVENYNQFQGGAHGYSVISGTPTRPTVINAESKLDHLTLTAAELATPAMINNYQSSTFINLADILIGYHPGTSAIADFVSISEKNGNTEISIDRDGKASTFHDEVIATLNHVSGLDLHDLLAHITVASS